jgi:hypothetical protein
VSGTLSDLPALAEANDWMISDTSAPDFFGDVRVKCVNVFGDEMVMVFANTGKLAGIYLWMRDLTTWHSENWRDAMDWIREKNEGWGFGDE